MAKSIEINYKSENGYEVLYPSTTPEQAGSLSIGGGEMQGPLYLQSDPSSGNQACTKQYVDNFINNINSELGEKIEITEIGNYIYHFNNLNTNGSMTISFPIGVLENISMGFAKIRADLTIKYQDLINQGQVQFRTNQGQASTSIFTAITAYSGDFYSGEVQVNKIISTGVIVLHEFKQTIYTNNNTTGTPEYTYYLYNGDSMPFNGRLSLYVTFVNTSNLFLSGDLILELYSLS